VPAKRILCVEDNEDTCFILETLLGRQDFEVVSAPDAEEALRRIEREKFDLYVVDTALPVMSGLDFCKEVRKADAKTPILIYSAAAFDADREEGMLAGANAYIAKPNVEEIVPTVRRLLGEPAM
jgi:two-component system, OmpR family, phosphate regulon response regulator PhoB